MEQLKQSRIAWLAGILTLSLMLGGCAGTQQAQRSIPQASGFLKDYSILKRGNVGQALLRYRNPTADFSAYDKILLEPVAIWYTEGSTLHNAPREDLQRLADEFYTIVSTTLGTSFEMVDTPGPGVMRVRLALTEAEKSSLSLDMSSDPSLPPLASKERKVATYLQAFVGKAGAEGEFTDAQSGELLAAAVDRRTGDKSFTVMTNSWDDVREVFQFWATQMDERLREWRSTSGI